MTTQHDDSPYLGLRPFTESEKGKFFGRDEEIHILTDKILAHRLTLLVAASGVGKSSLLQAGVMPQLRASGMADLIYHNAWMDDPTKSLKQSIVNHFIQQQRVTADYAPDLDQPLNEFLQTHALLGIGTVVILLDQFEEFFYYQKFSLQRDQFIQQLAAALHDSDTPTAFVFSMREDFAMEMEAFKPFFKGIFDNIYRIEKLELAAARAAILKPIEAICYHYQPALLEQLLADLGRRERNERLDLQHTDQAAQTEARVEPPHLQIICQQLWQHAHASASKEIGLDHYQQLGCAEGILSSYFNDKMGLLNRAQQRLASRAFDLLVSQHGAKMAYPLDELAKLLRENPDSLQISLDQLQTAAILRRIQRQGKPWYELYHDIFAKSITEWNQAYKKKQLREQLLKRGGVISAVLLSILLAFDGWENHQQRHFRLGQETVSERVEVYQGKLGSWDIFGQRKFLYESDFERQDIEADKRIAAEGMTQRDNSVEMQIGELPLNQRFLNYAQAGLFDSADKVFEAIRKSGKDELIDGLASVRVRKSIERLLIFKEQKGSRWIFRSNDEHLITELLASIHGQATIPVLIALLNDTNTEVRRGAASALGKLKDPTITPRLLALLSDSDPFVRLSAVKALSNIKDPSITPKLIALLNDDYELVGSGVAKALGKTKDPAAAPKLIALLNDTNASVRSSAADALGELKYFAAIPKLIALLNDRNENVRSSIARALSKLNAPPATTPKLIALLNDPNADVRSSSARELGKLNNPIAPPQLIALLNDTNANVRSSAAWALGKLNQPAATHKLIALLNDTNANVRSSAVWALSKFKDPVITLKLIVLLNDTDAGVRSSAANALGNLKEPAITIKLIALLNDTDADVRSSAIEEIGKLKDPTLTSKLITLLNHSDAGVRLGAMLALFNLNDPAVTPKLIALLSDSDVRVQSDAVYALSELKVFAVTPTLITMLNHSNANIRRYAACALGNLKFPTSLAELFILTLNDEADVRGDAASSLGKLKAPASAPRLIELLADNEPTVQQAAALALHQMQQTPAALTQWQTQQLTTLQIDLKVSSRDDYRRAKTAKALGSVHLTESVILLGSLLKDSDLEVVSNALNSLANIGAAHSAWLQPYLPQLLQFTKHPDGHVQVAAIKALGSVITFSGGQKASDFKRIDETVQQTLLGIAQDGQQKPFLRMAALDALSETGRDEVVKTLLTLLADPQQKTLHFNITYWLTQLNYRPAQAALQAHFDTLVKQKSAWRAARDAGKFVRSDKEELTAQKNNSWQDDYQLYQYAYALARIAPEKDGVALLSHPLYQVRQAAIQALAEKANIALLQQVLAAHQAFNASNLPSPFPTTAYRALDKMLYQLEFNGTKADLALLKTLKAKNFPAQPKQRRALNERFDWTIAELEYRLGKK
jgi:HEAT repeat protein